MAARSAPRACSRSAWRVAAAARVVRRVVALGVVALRVVASRVAGPVVTGAAASALIDSNNANIWIRRAMESPRQHSTATIPRMDILDRLLGHDAYTTRLLLSRCELLSDEQVDREFPIGPGTL